MITFMTINQRQRAGLTLSTEAQPMHWCSLLSKLSPTQSIRDNELV